MPSEVVLALLAVGIAVIPWAMSIHSKVALIAMATSTLPELLKKIDQHEQRLNNHDTEISRLAATRVK